MEKKRLSKALAGAGVSSRRGAEELIYAGRVSVNGECVLIPQTLVDLDTDQVLFDGEPVHQEERKRYLLLNKPKGLVCSNKPGTQLQSVLDLFQNFNERLFTVGRLDVETTGLLLVTNDGEFANRVIHPSSGIQKEYLVKTTREVGPEHLKAIKAGTFVEGVYVRPLRITKVRRGTCKIVVKEGRKREVRRLFESVGLKVCDLSRIRLGNLHLGHLDLGWWRELSLAECEKVFD